jgi:outer membrane scaffolding protein for murein synthesis (MipA/OmpV family)
LTKSWAAVFIGGYDRLDGDAAASPLLQQRGNASQTTVGLFVSRQF